MTKNLWCGCTITMRSGCSVQQRNTVGMRFSGKRSCRRAFFGCFQGFRSCEPEGRGAGWLSYCYRTQYGLHPAQKAGQGTDGAFPWRRVLCLWRDACRRNGSFKENGGIRWPLSGLSLPHRAFFAGGRYFQQRSDRNCQMIWDAGQTAYE